MVPKEGAYTGQRSDISLELRETEAEVAVQQLLRRQQDCYSDFM